MSPETKAIGDAIDRVRMQRYAGWDEQELKAQLLRAEDSRRVLGNVFYLALLGCYVVLFRKELIQILTKIGKAIGDG